MNVIVEDFSVFAQYPVDKTLTGKLRVRNLGVSLLYSRNNSGYLG